MQLSDLCSVLRRVSNGLHPLSWRLVDRTVLKSFAIRRNYLFWPFLWNSKLKLSHDENMFLTIWSIQKLFVSEGGEMSTISPPPVATTSAAVHTNLASPPTHRKHHTAATEGDHFALWVEFYSRSTMDITQNAFLSCCLHHGKSSHCAIMFVAYMLPTFWCRKDRPTSSLSPQNTQV